MVFGRVPNITASPENPTATFTLDNNAPVVFNTVPSSQLDTLYQVPIFQAFNLSLSNHQLQIEAHDNTANLWFDFFMYEQPTVLPTTTAGSNSPTSSTSHRSSNHNALIDRAVGGVVGGVIGFILIVAVLAWFWRRRQRRNSLNLEFTPYLAVDSNNARGSLDQLLRTAGTSVSNTYPFPYSVPPVGGGSPSQVNLYHPVRKTPSQLSSPETLAQQPSTSSYSAGPVVGSGLPLQVGLYQPVRKPPLWLSTPEIPFQQPSTSSETMTLPSAIQLQERAGTLPPPYESHEL